MTTVRVCCFVYNRGTEPRWWYDVTVRNVMAGVLSDRTELGSILLRGPCQRMID